ncbi:hypothetical protein [Psychrobacter sp. DM4]|jgi:hypothetical protein|uniref:hypothetical protein n=1 Tax=Psychrobacter sp. DM4 TaxID=3440637 RepID=UPI003F50C008
MIEPFANNHQSMQIGGLTIENQRDKITIYGDIDIRFDELGYEQAQKLHELTSKVLQAFKDDDSYSNQEKESKHINDQSDKNIDNPFL